MGRAFNPVDPYDSHRLYGDERYNLQNMLLKQVSVPAELEDGDRSWEIYSDYVPIQWNEAWKLLNVKSYGDSMLESSSDESFLAFASKLVSLIEGYEITVTGAVAVRFTNVMSGFPTIRLTAVIAKDIPGRRYGVPYTRQTYREFMSMYGDSLHDFGFRGVGGHFEEDDLPVERREAKEE